MLKSLKNIDSSFRQIRWMMGLFFVLTSLLSAYIATRSFQSVSESRKLIYAFDQGSIIAARAQSIQENRPVEARNHVKKFHEYFFTLSPDEKAINYTIDRALFLASDAVKQEYENLKELGFYNKLIAGNVSQHIRIEQIVLDSLSYPYKLKTIAKLEIVRPSSTTIRNLVTECTLRDNVLRSDNNPHGFLIENWVVTDNSDIKTVKR